MPMEAENTATETLEVNPTPVNIENPSEQDLLSMDDDYIEMVKEEKAEDDSAGEKPVEDKAGKEADDSEKAGDPNDGDDQNAEDNEEKDAVSESDSEFEDNILPGLTGKQFESLDEGIREAVAKGREELDTVTKKASESEERLNKLLEDPIIKHRDEVMQNGQNEETYEIPGVDDQTAYKLQQLAQRKTPEAMAAFKEALHSLMGSAADTAADNVRLESRQEMQRQQTLDTANKNVSELAKLLKEELPSGNLEELKDVDISKLGKVGLVLKDLNEKSEQGVIGGVYNYLANVNPEELYASQAIKNNWPIMKNADSVVNKEIKKSNEKFYNRFLKAKPDEASGSLARGSAVNQKKAASKSVSDGIDKIKLATDDKYHEKMLYTKQDDPQWHQKISEMRIEGERMIEENPRLHVPQNK